MMKYLSYPDFYGNEFYGPCFDIPFNLQTKYLNKYRQGIILQTISYCFGRPSVVLPEYTDNISKNEFYNDSSVIRQRDCGF